MPIATCPAREELSGFMLGRLPTDDEASLEQHIDACPRCQQQFQSLEGTDDLLLDTLKGTGATVATLETDCRIAIERIAQLDPSAVSLKAPTASHVVAGLPTESPEDLGSIGFYKLLAKLGEGGMGAVYKAQHTRLRRTVAVKVLPADRVKSPQAIARFDREMQAVGALDHENIVRAFDAGDHDGRHFIAMEYIRGRDLSQIARAAGPLPVAEACEIIRQAAVGLQHAHVAGLVHRDIKPGNLILAESGVVKILDLGLARLGQEASGGDELTTTGQVMGTLDYMAPEQGGDTHGVDIRADIYSLGASLYKLLTGEVPFGKAKYDTPVKKLMALATLNPLPLQTRRPDVPPQLGELVQRMLAKSPEQRPATPAEVAQALTPFCTGANLSELAAGGVVGALPDEVSAVTDTRSNLQARSVVTTTSLPQAKSSGPPRWRSRQLIAAGCGGLALLLLGVVLYWSTKHGTVRIEINDPGITASFDEEGLKIDGADKKQITLTLDDKAGIASGEHLLHIKRGDLAFETDKFQLQRNGQSILRIELLKGEVQVALNNKKVGVNPLIAEASDYALRKGAPAPALAPFSANQARAHQDAWAKYFNVPVEYTNSIGMKFVLIPPGQFMMGATPAEIEEVLQFTGKEKPDWHVHIQPEMPRHRVVLTQPFYLGVHEVSQAAYEKVIGMNPSQFSAEGSEKEKVVGRETGSFPVDNVTWHDAARFCVKLSEKEELQPCYVQSNYKVSPIVGDGYRLPTEAQWEFACRAGTTTRYWIGDNDKDLSRVGWWRENSGLRSHAIGELAANPFGLYDTHGNIWEWVQDWFDVAYYSQFRDKPVIDPPGPTPGTQRVVRGGYWSNADSLCRSSDRAAYDPEYHDDVFGLRVALSVEAVKKSLSTEATKAIVAPDREANGTVFPAFTADPLHLVKQKDKYAEVRKELEVLKKTSKQNYHVVILPELGDYAPRAADYLEMLAEEWEEEAARTNQPFDAERLVIILMSMNDQQLQILFGQTLKDGLGLNGPPVTKELLVPHFMPYARKGKFSEGLISLLRATESWIVEHEDKENDLK